MANRREGCKQNSHTLVRPTDSCVLEQEVVKPSTLQSMRKIKPLSLALQLCALGCDQSPAGLASPGGPIYRYAPQLLQETNPPGTRASPLLLRAPVATALPRAEIRSLTAEMPTFPGETDSCLTATQQDNWRQEMKTDSHR